MGLDELAVHARQRPPGAGTRPGEDGPAATRRRPGVAASGRPAPAPAAGAWPAKAAAPAARRRSAATSATKRAASLRLADEGQGILQRIDPDGGRQPLRPLHPVVPLPPLDPNMGRVDDGAHPLAHRLKAIGQVRSSRGLQGQAQRPAIASVTAARSKLAAIPQALDLGAQVLRAWSSSWCRSCASGASSRPSAPGTPRSTGSAAANRARLRCARSRRWRRRAR